MKIALNVGAQVNSRGNKGQPQHASYEFESNKLSRAATKQFAVIILYPLL